jgi:hypothetical protein
MRRTTKNPKFVLSRGVIVFMLAACGSTSGLSGSPSSSVSQPMGGSPSLGRSPSKSAAATNSPVPKTDQLTGTWQSDPITAADVDANLRRIFPGSAVDAWERTQTHGGCYLKAGQTGVQILHFDGGQLVISEAMKGGSAQEGWTGSYVVKDSDTFKAVDQFSDHLYITVDFKIKGNRLFTDLIKDDFPDHTPWSDAQDGPGMSKLNGIVGKPLGDTMCQVEIYETTPFTRIG